MAKNGPHLGGRPPEWTPDKLQELHTKFLQYIHDNDIPIIAEFAYLNDINRQRLYEWEMFSDTIKKCTSKKEAALERMGLTNQVNTTMAIFSLKQLGWRDKQELDVTGHVSLVTEPVKKPKGSGTIADRDED